MSVWGKSCSTGSIEANEIPNTEGCEISYGHKLCISFQKMFLNPHIWSLVSISVKYFDETEIFSFPPGSADALLYNCDNGAT